MSRVFTGLACLGALVAGVSVYPTEGNYPGHQGRIYPVNARDVWRTAHAWLEAVGLPTAGLDQERQALVTEARFFGDVKGAPRPDVGPGYIPEAFQVHLYVSPFVEPARLYVGTVVRAAKPLARKTVALAYNSAQLNGWVFDGIETLLNTQGRLIPLEQEDRRRLSLALSPDGADPCLVRGFPESYAAGTLIEPKRIQSTQVEIPYPVEEQRRQQRGAVAVELLVLEDGAVSPSWPGGLPTRNAFGNAAIGALSLLKYEPTRYEDCPVPTYITFTVQFHGSP
jgi:hypothetical protein